MVLGGRPDGAIAPSAAMLPDERTPVLPTSRTPGNPPRLHTKRRQTRLRLYERTTTEQKQKKGKNTDKQ